jgi:hypothetical protein
VLFQDLDLDKSQEHGISDLHFFHRKSYLMISLKEFEDSMKSSCQNTLDIIHFINNNVQFLYKLNGFTFFPLS